MRVSFIALSICSQLTLCHSFHHVSNSVLRTAASNLDISRRSMTTTMTTSAELGLNSNDQIVKQLYIDANTGKRTVFSAYVTGGGVSLLSWLLTVPGGSNTVSNLQVPYSRASLKKLLSQYETDNSTSYETMSLCSPEISIKLAKAAYINAMENLLVDEPSAFLNEETLRVFGVGCTAALASNVPKKGDHRCYISTFSGEGVRTVVVNLKKGARDRKEEDEFCSSVLLNEIAHKCGSVGETRDYYQDEVLPPTESKCDLVSTLLSSGNRHTTLFAQVGNTDIENWVRVENVDLPRNSLIVPGSFNPLHDGHIEMVLSSLRKLQSIGIKAPLVVFEIAAINADKPSIPVDTILQRIRQFDLSLPIFSKLQAFGIPIAVSITSLPLFVAKSEVFRNCFFAIGADTFCRLVDLKYYKPLLSETSSSNIAQLSLFNPVNIFGLSKAMTMMERSGARFIVGGRVKKPSEPSHDESSTNCPNEFQTMSDIVVSNECAQLVTDMLPSMFISLNETEFRLDVSSTLLRNKNH